MIGHFIQLTAVLIRCLSVRIGRIGIRANCIETYETYETKPKQTSVSVTETDTKLGFSFNTFLSITDWKKPVREYTRANPAGTING